MVSLDDEPQEESPARMPQRARTPLSDPDREMYVARLGGALCDALAGLHKRERLILACYYVDRLTLAEIGRILREHESTVSRQLDRTRRALREDVAERLRRGEPACDGRKAEAGLDEAQIEQAFEYALQDWPFDLSRTLARDQAAADPPG